MKKQISFFVALLAMMALNVHAATWTVSNNSNSPGQFTSLQAAIDNAAINDTLLVAGSTSSYGSINLGKTLVLVGAGYNNPYESNSIINVLTLFRTNLYISASSSKIMGFVISNIGYSASFSGGTDSTRTLNNIVIERCQFNSLGFGDGDTSPQVFSHDTIRNCIINGDFGIGYGFHWGCIWGYRNLNNIQIHNNIFNGSGFIDGCGNGQDYSKVFVRNNIFINKISPIFNNIHNMILENNLFYAADPLGGSNCVFTKNLTFMCLNNTIPGSGNLGSGNLVNQNPLFVNYPLAGGGFSYSYNFYLQPGSPGKNAGTDGTDLGIYGGWMPFEVGANPYFPQMMEVTLPNGSSVPAGGTLYIHFKARKQN